MLSVDENVVSYLLKKLNVNIQRLNDSLDEQINAFPKVSGSELYLSGASAQVVQKTQTYLKEFKDDYISVEHLLLGILAGNDKAASLLKEQGVTEKDIKKAIQELRGGSRVSDPNAEADRTGGVAGKSGEVRVNTGGR